MLYDLTFETARANAEHLKALGQDTIYLRRDNDLPLHLVTRVESGSTFRLDGPTSCYLIAEVDGLTFKSSVDFEQSDANGRGVSLFDRVRLRELMLQLTPEARRSFADMLTREVLGPLKKRSDDIRQAMLAQADSEDCVRGLIAFAEAGEIA